MQDCDRGGGGRGGLVRDIAHLEEDLRVLVLIVSRRKHYERAFGGDGQIQLREGTPTTTRWSLSCHETRRSSTRAGRTIRGSRLHPPFLVSRSVSATSSSSPSLLLLLPGEWTLRYVLDEFLGKRGPHNPSARVN